jgi:hypothetical protein
MRLSETARVVIGAQFGDEGKGRWIDDYAAETGRAGIVIRFNGGAQAGHTVVTPEGSRHVFSHRCSAAPSPRIWPMRAVSRAAEADRRQKEKLLVDAVFNRRGTRSPGSAREVRADSVKSPRGSHPR